MSRLSIAVTLLCSLATHSAWAEDTRHVEEPRLPSQVCATLEPLSASAWQNETARLQDALNRCPQGQAVRLAAGAKGAVFPSGPLQIPSGVTLWLDKTVVLTATTDARAYDNGAGTCGRIDNKGTGCRPFIHIVQARGSAIVGQGEIDGQGDKAIQGTDQSWWQLARQAQRENGKQNNPRLIEIDRSRDITLYGLRLHNAANFHVVAYQVDGFTAWGLIIDTAADARNTDGIDPMGSSNVTLAHNFIRTGDDNVAIKAGSQGPSRHLSILDNHFYSGHGMSIGSETNSGVADVLVRGLTLDGTTSGIRIKSDASRGGIVQDVRYQDICLRNNRQPIDIDTAYAKDVTGNAIPVYRDIVLQHVHGADGILRIQASGASPAIGLTLDDVHFAPTAQWQVSRADLKAGPGGVSPPVPGLNAPAGSPAPSACDQRWTNFPQSADSPGVLKVGATQRYRQVQEAVDAARPGDTIRIDPGVYREVVHITVPRLRLTGAGSQPDDVVIEADHSAGDSGGTAKSATVFAQADDLQIDHLTIANRFHEHHPEVSDGAQAIALSATGDRQRFIGLHLLGSQDTLYAGGNGHRQYYQNDLITGTVDFIFGDALAYFEHIELRGVQRSSITLTAQSRVSAEQHSGFVFHDCTVSADSSVQTISLGRPWRDLATVSYLGCELDGRVLPQGFTEWNQEHRLPTARYAEVGSRGAGRNPQAREAFMVKLDAATLAQQSDPARFLAGADGWNPR
ncbi:pectinesterase family protein [Pseudomonas fuscovaginae UPB0736]|uniref:pectinesterase family protein n=1 Tax=Pseudomonas asplenii TaxID=53407 RepID=UPI000288FB36|nr:MULTISPECIES: pectinesterase family protein [Pseudomonas]UUQ65055.1 pectinesterase family protein [Pseudomonas fuscovaginae UPB0736]UZE31711.1 pectinesterase family protein [Pseudomonas asplenii]